MAREGRIMLKTIEWGRNRFKPMVMFAHTMALNAAECYELISSRAAGLDSGGFATGENSSFKLVKVLASAVLGLKWG